VVGLNVRAEARTYLRNKSKGKSRSKSKGQEECSGELGKVIVEGIGAGPAASTIL
jgi:hypothetical protein